MFRSTRTVAWTFLVLILCTIKIQKVVSEEDEPDLITPENSSDFVVENSTDINNSNSTLTKSLAYYGNINIGIIGVSDRLLLNQYVLYQINNLGYVSYTHTFNAYGKISAIRITNYYYDGYTATAQILSGGVGYTSVTVRFRSDWKRGFYYGIRLYGY